MFSTPPQQAENRIGSVPAPIGGLNARDSFAAMPETDAVVLQNFWPQPYGVSIRKGWQTWVQLAVTTEVSTLATWSGADGQQKLFAWTGTTLWDVSTRGAPPGSASITGLTNAFWQTIGMTNAAGAHLIAVNGADNGIVYSSTGFNRLVVGDGIAAYTWKNLDPKNAIQVTIHQHRLWAVEKNSARGYYLPGDAIYGVMSVFDFGPLFSQGGYLAFLTTWTVDDGNGAEDHLVAVSSTGYAAVYAGIDPNSADTWKLVGVYNTGAPVKGRRSYAKVGGDLFILTQQGIVSMAGLVTSTTVNGVKQSFPSDKIQYLMSELIGNYSDLANWQLNYTPKINMLICNVPVTVPGGNIQLVSNQITNAWAQFAGMDAAVWTTFSDQPFFGTYDGRVCIAWEGFLDNVNSDGVTGGTSVVAIGQQAYSYLNAIGVQKQVGMYRPRFIVGQHVPFNSAILYDFATQDLPIPDGEAPGPGGARWNAAFWGQALWYGGVTQQRGWIQASGMGVAASIAIAAASNEEALWVSTDYSYRVGSLL